MNREHTSWTTRLGSALCLGLLVLLGACSSPEEAAALEALGAPSTERWANDHIGPLGPYDCGSHEGAGDVRFVDEWGESGAWTDYFNRHGELTRSRLKVNFDGTFTDIGSGYQLSYKGALNVFYDYVEETAAWTGVEIKIVNEDGKIVSRNIGRWVWGPEGLEKGAGHQDFTGLICGFFPQA
ncbi:MAG TPA: hypothetical protein VFD39_00735 [Trueperaceae bacterium]|nr:hypothetical protein [Trueperaceae bacterium]